MKALDGLRAGKTPRQIAVDIYGADEVAAEWYSEPVLAGRAADEPVDRQLFHDVGAVRRPVREQPGNHGQLHSAHRARVRLPVLADRRR